MEILRRVNLRKKELLSGIAGVALTFSIGFGIVESIRYDAEIQRQNDSDVSEAYKEAREDGFDASEIFIAGNGNVSMNIDLGNCSIGGVLAEMVHDETGHVSDLRQYSISGYSQPITRIGKKHTGGLTNHVERYEYTDGIPVTYEFSDKNDLLNNILGEDPCVTLLNNFVQD